MPKKQCTGPGCYAVIEIGQRWCDLCKKRDNKRRDSRDRDPESRKLYNSKLWRETLRPGQLAGPSDIFPNGSPFCQCSSTHCKQYHRGSEACGAIATEVDHIIPISFGGEPRDPKNFQSLCHDCHSCKTRKEDGWSGGKKGRNVIVVCGPPGSGKSSWVNKHANKTTDLILDFDRIMSAITNFPFHRKPEHLLKYGWEARDAILDHLDKEKNYLKAWIIDTGTKRARRDQYRARYGARVFVLETPALLCKQRIEQDEHRDQSYDWSSLVEDWWQHYEPSNEDNVINE